MNIKSLVINLLRTALFTLILLIAKAFSSCFIAANPLGVNCGSNNEEFKTAMSQGYAFYKNTGGMAMDIVSLETTILDNFHEIAKVIWRCNYIKKITRKK